MRLTTLAVLLALALAACGSSSNESARTLLRQTFSGQHKVNSGVLRFALNVDPSGSSTLTQPVNLSFGGPFQSRGTGKLPASNFTVSIGAQGQSGSLSILSTGTKGFVTLSGTSYQLPASSFQRLESSFTSITNSGGGSSRSGSGTLARLGINPLDWLTDPRIVGQQTIGGAQTTHIRATVNVPALLRDLNTFLGKAGSLGVSGAGKLPSRITPAQQARIAGEVQHPSFDVWTGTSDKTVRRLTVGLTLPVTGQISALLGGMKQAALQLTLEYSNLNQPETITAPTSVQPYSVFQSKLATLLQAVEGGLGAGALGSAGTGSAGSGAAGSTTTGGAGSSAGGGAASATSSYSQCLSRAGSDIAKMQKCAALLNGQGG